MARTFDATQTSIVGSDVKVDVSWLFEIDTDNDGTPEYYYSTKSKTFAAQPYTAKILDFSPITMRRGASESGIQAPSKFSFSISNASNALNASDFEGANVTVKLVINNGSDEAIICTWAFEVIGYSGAYQKINLECRDWLQKYLEGDYPNTAMVDSLFPSNDPKAEICVPVVYGTPYIPIPSVYITDKRYYVLGKHVESLGSEDLTNGGFETAGGGGADIWDTWEELVNDGVLANETTIVHGGSDAAKLTSGPTKNTKVTQTFTPTSGRIHKLTFWTRGDGTYSLRYRIQDATNSAYLTDVTSAGVTGTDYTEVSVYFTVPYNCTSIKIIFISPDHDAAYAYLDDVSVKPDEQYTISKVRSPKEHNSQSEWTALDGYLFEYYRKQGSDNNYYVVSRYIIADSNADGTADDNGLFNGGETFLPVPTKFTDANTSSYTNPGDWINQILQDMGVPSGKIDSTTLTAVKGTFSGWGLTFNGGWWYKMGRKKLLAKLLTMCDLELIIRDKIYFKVHSKTSQQTITSAYVMKKGIVGEGSFSISPIIGNERKDSGMCSYQEVDVPIDRMISVLVPAKSSTNYISNETIECDFIQDDQIASGIAQLALQRKLLTYQNIDFTTNGKLLKLEADDVITISGDNYGGEGTTYDVLIDEIRYNKDCSLDISAIRFSDSLDDYGDLSPSAVSVASDDSLGTTYEPVIQGPATTLTSTKPNSITGTVYVGDDSNNIEISGDPDGSGDRWIAIGKTKFDNTETGFIIGIDHSASDTVKFYLGNTTNYLNWTGSAFVLRVTSANAITVEAGGDILLAAAAANPGIIKFQGTSYTTTLGPQALAAGNMVDFIPETNADDDEQCWLNIGKILPTELKWLGVSIYTYDGGFFAQAYYDSNNSGSLLVDCDSGSGSVIMGGEDGGTVYTVAIYTADPAFKPNGDQTIDCGTESFSWNNIWYKVAHDEADYFLMDNLDDLALICQIKGSGQIDPNTGLEKIDDNTLPDVLLSKYQEDKEEVNSNDHKGKRIKHKKGDVIKNTFGKPYINNTVLKSLLIGCIKQLNQKIDDLQLQIDQLS